MLLTYNHLTIRNATVDDAEQLALWWNDGRVMAHAGFPNGTGQTVQEIVNDLQKDTDLTRRRLIIEIDSDPIGEMVYRDQGDLTAQIGIKICDLSKQNKGIGKIVLSMLIASLFNDLGYQKVVLDTDLKNERAQHVYEQLGFTKLRVHENWGTDQLGAPLSSVDYELYPADFINYADGASSTPRSKRSI